MSALPFSPSNTTNDDLFVRAADTDGTFMCAPFLRAFKEALVLLLLSFLFNFFFVVVKWNLNASFSASRSPVMNTNEIPIKLPERYTRGDDRFHVIHEDDI